MSVARQNYARIEHIVIDNCSRDKTLEVLAEFRDREHLRVISEPDDGQSQAINKGVSLARGEWCLWLNADDALAPGALNAFADAIKHNPNADLFYGHTHFVDAEGNWQRTVFHIPYNYGLTFYKVYMPPSTGSLFRTSVLRQHPLDESYHYTMDTEWFLRCGRGLNAYLIDATVSHFRVSGRNKTAQQLESGRLSPKHRLEQEAYTERWILPRVPGYSNTTKRAVYRLARQLARLRYYSAKLLYLRKYVGQRSTSAVGEPGCGST